MKKIACCLALLIAFGSLHAQTNTGTAPVQDIEKVISFSETDHDLGKIPYGKPVEFDLELKNISKDSVKIDNVQAGCGCTTPKWQAGPYAPGQKFKITLGFNGYTEGHFVKSVTVYFSNGLTKQLLFHGDTYKDQPAAKTK
ncbi:DUF1573 domain-containing protein [Filimonas effusa]|uniref:DUF1573 domain-containing protein n=1 Tax=Filimonas effusa TaxID=2508721 RepID=A0A4Q1D3L3_9BACT|nr:DUF1573 domain-containing protein [Filimonas effusa]RXK82975.1 DUF1573 domain-containing protein [Filimonas effusa]